MRNRHLQVHEGVESEGFVFAERTQSARHQLPLEDICDDGVLAFERVGPPLRRLVSEGQGIEVQLLVFRLVSDSVHLSGHAI